MTTKLRAWHRRFQPVRHAEERRNHVKVVLCIFVPYAVAVSSFAKSPEPNSSVREDVASTNLCAEAFLYRECVSRPTSGIEIERILYLDAFLTPEIRWDGVVEFNQKLTEMADAIGACVPIPNCLELHQGIVATLHEAKATSRRIMEVCDSRDLEELDRLHQRQLDRGHLDVLSEIDGALSGCASMETEKAPSSSSIGYWHCLDQWARSREDATQLVALARAKRSEDPAPGFLAYEQSRIDLADRLTRCKPVNGCLDLHFELAGFWSKGKKTSEKRIHQIDEGTVVIRDDDEFSHVLEQEFSFVDQSMEIFWEVFGCATSIARDFAELVATPADAAITPRLANGPEYSGEITITLPGGVPLELVHIPAGTFHMGSPPGELGRYADLGDEDLHEVTLTADYYLGKYEVTQEQWLAVMGTPMPSACGSFSNGGDYPVFCVSWNDVCGDTAGTGCSADSFIGRLNRHLGVSVFRLPTEAEWERAARAGTQTPFSFDAVQRWDLDCGGFPEAESFMWWCGNDAPPGPKPVGKKLPNPYGLHDMHGNINEWVADWWAQDLGTDPQIDPRGASTGEQRVTRGGHYGFTARGCRSAFRMIMPPSVRTTMIGFRVAMSEGR